MNTSLFSDTYPFFGLFRRQAGALGEAARELAGLFEGLQDVSARCRRVEERAADGLAAARAVERELALALAESPDREDIRDLNRAFELAFQALRAVSSRTGLYGVCSPEKGAAELGVCLAEMAAEIGPLLECVVRQGSGAERRERVRGLRAEAGMFLLVGLGAVYESAAGQPDHLLEVMKWSQIYDRLEEAVACLERAANVIERMILKKV